MFYNHHIFCCTNLRPDGHKRGSCAAKGSEGLRNYMKEKAKELGLEGTRVNTAGCLDRCELGPVIVSYPEGHWYSAKTRDDVDAILLSIKNNTAAPPHLILRDAQRPIKE